MRVHRICIAAALTLLVGCSKGDKSKESTSSSTGAPGDSVARQQPASAFRAFGNEPFWSVTINSNELRFITPEDTAGLVFPSIAPVASGDTLQWSGKTEHGAIDVHIWPGACGDGMSDQTWSHSSSVRLNETIYVGCAETLDK